MTQLQKVGIVVPSSDRVHANFAMALAVMSHVTRAVNLVFINPKGSNVAKQRHIAVRAARASECDYILMVDSDLTFPPASLLRLLVHRKDIVGAAYPKRIHPSYNLIVPPDMNWNLPKTGCVEVDALPGGMMLIKMSVFRAFKEPFFRFGVLEEGEQLYGGICKGPDLPGEDYGFCREAKAKGFKLWCDMDLTQEIVHWGEVGYRITDPSALQATEHVFL